MGRFDSSCWAAAVQKDRSFQSMLSILYFWDAVDLKTWTRQRVELEQYLSLGQLCQLEKVDELLGLQVLL